MPYWNGVGGNENNNLRISQKTLNFANAFRFHNL